VSSQRRRTQIRLAQRAYRNRKETAIQTLEKKVQALKDNNEEMSNAFMKLYDFAVAQGMLESAPEFGRQLQSTTEKFVALARRSSDDDPKEEEQSAPSSGHYSEDNSQSPEHKGINKDISPQETLRDASKATQLYGGIIMTEEPDMDQLDTPSTFSTSYGSLNPTNTALEYEVITKPTPDNASFPFGMSLDPDLGGLVDPSPATTVSTSMIANPAFGISPFPNLPPPMSYSYQERTFGRRLQREAIEKGLVLISMPNPPPHLYASVFGFCLLFESPEKIIDRLTTALSASEKDSMHFWKHPFLHLNGAGTFFEDLRGPPTRRSPLCRDDATTGKASTASATAPDSPLPIGNQGTVQHFQPEDRSAKFSMGPWSAQVEETKEQRMDAETRINIPDFQGEFFDTDEVEYYFRERDIVIPQGADFIEAVVDLSRFVNSGDSPGFLSRAASASTATTKSSSSSTSISTANTVNDFSSFTPSTSSSMTSLLSPALNFSDVWSSVDTSAPAPSTSAAAMDIPFSSKPFASASITAPSTMTGTSTGLSETSLLSFTASPRQSLAARSTADVRHITLNIERLVKGIIHPVRLFPFEHHLIFEQN
jgi:hypothetical protein